MSIKTQQEFDALPSGTELMVQNQYAMLMVIESDKKDISSRSLFIEDKPGQRTLIQILRHEQGYQVVSFIAGYKLLSEIYPWDDFTVIHKN